MTNFPVFQFIAFLVIACILIIFAKDIFKIFKKVKHYFKVRKFRTTRKKGIKFAIAAILEQEIGYKYNAGITEIKVKGKRVIIYSFRPGIVIGKRGYLINMIKEQLKRYYKVKKIDIKESNPFG